MKNEQLREAVADIVDAWLICGKKEPNDKEQACVNELQIYRKAIKRIFAVLAGEEAE